ncbi:hypothetical protein ACQ4N7_28290 [Nodosilinea sp. AN01ver1]|uniref:hypothetical protein n=1 Tax=Nodosilinea sp. AN01ver1 TaxID=3423362 RepID=UPI003D312EA6
MAPQPLRKNTRTTVGQKKAPIGSKAIYAIVGGVGLLTAIILSTLATGSSRPPLPTEVVNAEAAIAQIAPETSETPEVQPELEVQKTLEVQPEPGVQPEPKLEANAQASGQSAYSQVMDSAVMKAESAQNITQSAVSSSDWELITARWQEAIYIIEQIPESDSLYGEAQEKREAYLLALSYARQGKPVPNAAATFSEAVNAATEASRLAQQALTAEEWRNVEEKWREASILMSQVPDFAENYQLAQEKASEYANNQNYAELQANRPIAPAPIAVAAPVAPAPLTFTPPAIEPITTTTTSTTSIYSGGSSSYTTSSSSSGSSGSGLCDYPWQTDRAGNRCGDRAASVRPGGSLGGSGSSYSGSSSSGSNCHYVSGYTRKNGTYVSGYTRCR